MFLHSVHSTTLAEIQFLKLYNVRTPISTLHLLFLGHNFGITTLSKYLTTTGTTQSIKSFTEAQTSTLKTSQTLLKTKSRLCSSTQLNNFSLTCSLINPGSFSISLLNKSINKLLS